MEENRLVYDLSQDLVVEEVRTLKTLSLLSIVRRLYTPELILQHVNPMYPDITQDYNIMKDNKRIWKSIEVTIVRQAKSLIYLSMENEIDEATHLVGSQIYLFLSKNCYPRDILHKILRNLVFTSQGTINTKETFGKVIRLRDVPNTTKFEIACRNFMGESVILKYFRKLPQNVIRNYLNESIERDEQIAILFFVCRFTGEIKKMDRNIIRNDDADPVFIYFANVNHKSAIEYLFYWAVLSFNDVATHYIWDEYISRMERRVLISCTISNFHGDIRLLNIIIYLLSNSNEDEIEIGFKACSCLFIQCLLQQARWHDSFIKIIQLIKSHFDNESYVLILKFMVYILCGKYLMVDKFSKRVFREFIRIIPQYVKIDLILERENFISDMLTKLFLQRDLEAFTIFIEIDDLLGADRILRMEVGLVFFEMLVCISDYIFINGVLENISSTPDDIRQFENRLLDRKGYGICDFFIMSGKFENLEEFLIWCQTFATHESISSSLYMENGNLIRKLLFLSSENHDGLVLATKLLGFCFNTRKQKKFYKNRLNMTNESRIENEIDPDTYSINLYTDVRDCAINSKFSFLSRLFSWRNCDYDEIQKIKYSLLIDDEFFRVIFLERKILSFIPPFLRWYNCRFNDRNYFNNSFLKQDLLFEEKVIRREFKLIRDLIKILQPSDIEVQNFKKKLYRRTAQFLHSILYPTPELRNFLLWITPPA